MLHAVCLFSRKSVKKLCYGACGDRAEQHTGVFLCVIRIGRDVCERVHPPYSQSVHCVRAAPELSRYCYHGDPVRGCTRRNSAYRLSARALNVNASLARNDERGSLERRVHAGGIEHRVNAGKYPRIVYRKRELTAKCCAVLRRAW